MKTNRHKKAKKNLSFYVNNYKFRQPYQVLIDGTFAFAALENKFNIHDQISKYLQSEAKLLTTPCIILETEKLGSLASNVIGAMRIVKQYPIHKCGHEKHPITGAKCLKSMIGKDNPSRYIVATQDRELQDTLRKIPGVPLIYLHGKAPTLESPSEVSRACAENVQKGLGMSNWEKENVKALKQQEGLTEDVEVKPKKKRKKSGPNPLSCLKKKKKPNAVAAVPKSEKTGKVKKRKKIKIPSHVKEVLITELAKKQTEKIANKMES